MRTTHKRVLAGVMVVILTFVLGFAMAACGGKSDPKENFIGTWDLKSLEDSADPSNNVSEDDMSLLNSSGMSAFINLNEDDTCDFVLFDMTISGKWEATSDTEAKITLEESGQTEELMATLDGDTLSITMDTTTMKFAKGDAKEAPDTSSEGTVEEAEEEAVQAEEGEEVTVGGATHHVILEDGFTPVQVADDDVCTITITGKGMLDGETPCYVVDIKNNLPDKGINYYAQVEGSTSANRAMVNGQEVSTGRSETILSSNPEETNVIAFNSLDSLDQLTNVEFTLMVTAPDNEGGKSVVYGQYPVSIS